jgi:hypothetical protein
MRNEVFKMVALVILCFVIGAILISLGVFYLYLDHLFKHQKEQLGKTFATRRAVTRKKDVKLWEVRSSWSRVPRVVGVIRDWRKGRYEYSVNGRSYWVRVEAYNNPEKLRPALPVTYWKRFPRIACAKTDLFFSMFAVYSVVCFGIAALFLMVGLMAL